MQIYFFLSDKLQVKKHSSASLLQPNTYPFSSRTLFTMYFLLKGHLCDRDITLETTQGRHPAHWGWGGTLRRSQLRHSQPAPLPSAWATAHTVGQESGSFSPAHGNQL